METGITVREVRTEEDTILRECAMMGAIRRKEQENAELRERIAEYEKSRKRRMAAVRAKYERQIEADKAELKAYNERVGLILEGIGLFFAGAGVMALMIQFAFMCVGG